MKSARRQHLIDRAKGRNPIPGIQPKNSLEISARPVHPFRVERVRQIDPNDVLATTRRRCGK